MSRLDVAKPLTHTLTLTQTLHRRMYNNHNEYGSGHPFLDGSSYGGYHNYGYDLDSHMASMSIAHHASKTSSPTHSQNSRKTTSPTHSRESSDDGHDAARRFAAYHGYDYNDNIDRHGVVDFDPTYRNEYNSRLDRANSGSSSSAHSPPPYNHAPDFYRYSPSSSHAAKYPATSDAGSRSPSPEHYSHYGEASSSTQDKKKKQKWYNPASWGRKTSPSPSPTPSRAPSEHDDGEYTGLQHHYPEWEQSPPRSHYWHDTEHLEMGHADGYLIPHDYLPPPHERLP